MEKYKYIVNPFTGRKVKVSGRIGQRVIKVYLNQLGGRNGRAGAGADMDWHVSSHGRQKRKKRKAKRRKKQRAGLVLIFPHETRFRDLDLHIEDIDEFIKRRAGIVGYVFPTVNEILEIVVSKKNKFPRETPFILAGNFGEYLSEDNIKLILDNVKENPVIKKSFVLLPGLIPENLLQILTQSLIRRQIDGRDRIACICYATLPSKEGDKKVIFDAQLGLTGHMEPYDRGDPMNTIIRELKEEMGLDNSFDVIGRRGNSFVATINFS